MSDSFDREYCAYARLICHHAAPYVPRVFGYLKFPQATPFTSLNLPLLRYPAEALLLEDIRDARPLSAETLTLAVAIEATRAVEAVHAALVVHNDIVARNFLVVGEERVVIVDFDWAGSWPYDNLVTKNNMLRERGLVWGLVFQELPIYRVIMGNDRALRRKLWLEQREAWEWYGGGDEPEPASMEE